jgi:hypothetical protein
LRAGWLITKAWRFAAAWAGEFHRLQRLIALRAAIVVVGRTVMRGSASIRSIR